jgi:hypothetical protein
MISIQYSDNPKKRRAQKIALWTVAGLAGAVVFGLLFGFLIQFLWNATLAEMFDIPKLSFWQAIGLFVLAKLFFGFGAGGSGSNRRRRRKRRDDRGPVVESADVTELADDETFKKFWQEEGKASYETYRRGGQPGEPDEST